MSVPQTTTIVGTVVGTSATTFPWWKDTVALLSGLNSWVIAIGGLLVLGLTLYRLALEIMLARRRLKDMDKGGDR